MGKTFKSALSALAMIALFALIAIAQETTGGLQGTVKDPQGAVVPGATSAIKGVSVGFSRTLNADQEGYFKVQELPPGDYSISVTATGFSMTPVTAHVSVGKSTEVPLSLAITGSTATVDVNATDSQI